VLDLWTRARSADASTPDARETVEQLVRHAPGSLLVGERGGVVVGR
jgi:hypothetical protein